MTLFFLNKKINDQKKSIIHASFLGKESSLGDPQWIKSIILIFCLLQQALSLAYEPQV